MGMAATEEQRIRQPELHRQMARTLAAEPILPQGSRSRLQMVTRPAVRPLPSQTGRAALCRWTSRKVSPDWPSVATAVHWRHPPRPIERHQTGWAQTIEQTELKTVREGLPQGRAWEGFESREMPLRMDSSERREPARATPKIGTGAPFGRGMAADRWSMSRDRACLVSVRRAGASGLRHHSPRVLSRSGLEALRQAEEPCGDPGEKSVFETALDRHGKVQIAAALAVRCAGHVRAGSAAVRAAARRAPRPHAPPPAADEK